MEKVVVYTPQEDFFYNGAGAGFLVCFILIIVSVVIGYGLTSFFLPRKIRSNENLNTFFTLLIAGAVFGLLYRVIF